MDFQEFNELFNENDEFTPNFDLGLENWDNWEWETDGSVIIFKTTTTPTPNAGASSTSTIDLPEENSTISTLTDDDIHDFVVGQKAKSTVYKDKGGVRRLQNFMADVLPGETRYFYDLPKEEMDRLFCQFFILAKKIPKAGQPQVGDGSYEPDTLSSYRNAWQRVIAEKGYKFDIKKDPEFERSRNVLKSKRKQLTNQGKGNKPNAARALTQKEVDQLYETGFFGVSNAIALQRTVWWKLSLLFGWLSRA